MLKEPLSNYVGHLSEQYKLDCEAGIQHTDRVFLAMLTCGFTSDLKRMAHPRHKESTRGNWVTGELLHSHFVGTEQLSYTGLQMMRVASCSPKSI